MNLFSSTKKNKPQSHKHSVAKISAIVFIVMTLIGCNIFMWASPTKATLLAEANPIIITKLSEPESPIKQEIVIDPEPEEVVEVVETVPETTAPPTEPPTEPPQPKKYTLTFVGDCTLGSDVKTYGIMYSFIWTIGNNYDYPFQNVKQYFKNDDFTLINLEGVITDSETVTNNQFRFRGPTDYVNILTKGSVEAVNLANNHTMDFGVEGYRSTKENLEKAGITYVEKNSSTIYTTDSGLKIGLYAMMFNLDEDNLRNEISNLRQNGAEIIVVSAHQGVEGSYKINSYQQQTMRAMIDAGADIVVGHHPHVLQPIEEYNGGIIYYSLGNFCFGGHHWPKDVDSVIIQQEVIREIDGTVHLGNIKKIPCAITSIPDKNQNNFQPTPYEQDSEKYQRVLDKLDGTFKGPNLITQ